MALDLCVCNLEVPGSNPPPCTGQSLFLFSFCSLNDICLLISVSAISTAVLIITVLKYNDFIFFICLVIFNCFGRIGTKHPSQNNKQILFCKKHYQVIPLLKIYRG